MTLQELLRASDWRDVASALVAAHGKRYIRRYRRMYRELCRLPAWSDDPLILVIAANEQGSEVLGAGQSADGAEPQRFALDLVPWTEWLAYGVSSEDLRRWGGAVVAAHCLYEMAWNGFSARQSRQMQEELLQGLRDADEPDVQWFSTEEALAYLQQHVPQKPRKRRS